MSLDRLQSLAEFFVVEVKSRLATHNGLLWKVTLTPRDGGPPIQAEDADMIEAARRVVALVEADGRPPPRPG